MRPQVAVEGEAARSPARLFPPGGPTGAALADRAGDWEESSGADHPDRAGGGV